MLMYLLTYRYDARLLLDERPQIPEARSPSSTGWSDVPSDAEETFSMVEEDIEDHARRKKRKLLDEQREHRLKALQDEGGQAPATEETSDTLSEDKEVFSLLFLLSRILILTRFTQPDDAQRELMYRTARHLAASDNPAQLEMRILANHGADRRFCFLRGHWPEVWDKIKKDFKLEKSTNLLSALGSYSSSEED
jgi:hypothetical protein